MCPATSVLSPHKIDLADFFAFSAEAGAPMRLQFPLMSRSCRAAAGFVAQLQAYFGEAGQRTGTSAAAVSSL